MSISYGTITITDTTDLGQLSVYLTGSTVRQQVYDAGNNPPSTASYYPDWNRATGTPLLITPHVYFNGQSKTLSDSNIVVSWQKTEGGNTYALPVSPTTDICPESVNNKVLERPINLNVNSVGATYTATITYYPIDGDLQTTLQAIATLDLTIANNGLQGAPGASGADAKTLQLIGSGSHFAYTWDSNPIGSTSITLSVEKSPTIVGVHWYCDGQLIEEAGAPITALNLTVTTANISNYSPNYGTNKSAQFQVREIDSNGNEVTGGLVDYFTIYKLQEAQPGGSAYSAYLDNDQETISEHDGVLNFDNATTVFHLDKSGQNDLVANSGWTITITDSENITYTTGKSDFNKLPTGNDNEITSVTAMTGNSAWIEFTAHNSSNNISDQIKRFTLNKNSQVISHSLRLNSVVSNRNVTAYTYEPSRIVAGAIVRTGGGTEDYFVANAITATITYQDNTTSVIRNVANAPCNIDLNDKVSGTTRTPIKSILVTLTYDNKIVDTQTIAISSNGIDGQDGDDGTSPWNFILSNQFDAISTDFTYDTSQNFTITLPILAAQGATEKVIHLGGQEYPTISAPSFLTIAPKYYLGNTEVTTSGAVDTVKYTIPAGTDIGANGSIVLTLNCAENQLLTQTYTYKAQPEALKPIRIILTAAPTDVFENQEGTITVTPTALSGTEEIASTYWTNATWEAFVNGAWIAATSVSGVTISNNVLSVPGTAVEGYLGFRFTVSISKGGVVEEHTEYINLTDIDDPLQVTLHSTVGEQIINSQGMGVIYARVVRRGDQEDYDTVVPDNLLGIGTVAPTGAINTGDFEGKTGYCQVVLTTGTNPKPTGEIRYFWRTSTSASWVGYRGDNSNPYKYRYTWTFRNSSNQPYAISNETPEALNYAMNTSHNTQFVYIDASVIKDKVTAVAKVEL